MFPAGLLDARRPLPLGGRSISVARGTTFEMEEEMAERTVIKKIGPRKGPAVPIARNLEEHVFAAVFNEARALRDASDLADECGYGGSRWWSVVWDSRDGACFYLPHKFG